MGGKRWGRGVSCIHERWSQAIYLHRPEVLRLVWPGILHMVITCKWLDFTWIWLLINVTNLPWQRKHLCQSKLINNNSYIQTNNSHCEMHLLLTWGKLGKEKQEMCTSGGWVEDGVDDQASGGGGRPTVVGVLVTEGYRDWICSGDALFLFVPVSSSVCFFFFSESSLISLLMVFSIKRSRTYFHYIVVGSIYMKYDVFENSK